MSIENQGSPEQPEKKPGDVFSQQFQHPSVSARVPDRVRTGVFATGAIVQDSPDEFCVDFLQAMAQPRQVAARVILTPGMMNQFINAVRDNLKKYEQQFGPPPVLPKPPNERRPTIQEIYDELKLPDEMLSGTYANAVMIGHSASEFFFDFITRFYPTASVSSRVYVSAPQVPRLLETLNMALGQYQRRIANMQNPPGGQGGPPPQNM
jgi:hypothetical protein